MKIVFFTSVDDLESDLFQYLFSSISFKYSDVHIVAVRSGSRRVSLWSKFRKKIRLVGIFSALEITSGYPVQRFISKFDQIKLCKLLRKLHRPNCNFEPSQVNIVNTVNGDDAREVINSLHPDIIIQAGAGILKRQIFSISRVATLNLHHGIAPLIRGMNSIYWALWEREPTWVGATIHIIDDGIDTGPVLGYALIDWRCPREGFPSLYTRATEGGVNELLLVLDRLAKGEKWQIPVPDGRQVYRTTFSGWKMLWLAIRRGLF